MKEQQRTAIHLKLTRFRKDGRPRLREHIEVLCVDPEYPDDESRDRWALARIVGHLEYVSGATGVIIEVEDHPFLEGLCRESVVWEDLPPDTWRPVGNGSSSPRDDERGRA